jgi:hypothetical protein
MISTPDEVSGNPRTKRVGRPRPTTDSRISVDIRELFRHIGGNTGGRALYRWNSARGDQVPVATLFMLASPVLVKVTHVGGAMPEETLDVTYTPCRYGGRRAWFQCTKLGCGKRVAILYDHPRGFRCRHCCQLDYKSHRERSYDRMLRRSRRLRARVGGGANLTENFPPRPKGMHWATYERLLRSEAALWGEISSAAPDRLRSGGRINIR